MNSDKFWELLIWPLWYQVVGLVSVDCVFHGSATSNESNVHFGVLLDFAMLAPVELVTPLAVGPVGQQEATTPKRSKAALKRHQWLRRVERGPPHHPVFCGPI